MNQVITNFGWDQLMSTNFCVTLWIESDKFVWSMPSHCFVFFLALEVMEKKTNPEHNDHKNRHVSKSHASEKYKLN